MRRALLLLLLAAPLAGAQDLATLDAAGERAGLFDPRGMRRVRTLVIEDPPAGRLHVEAWAPADEERPGWVLLDDLSLAPVAPDAELEDADFAAGRREWLRAPRPAGRRFGGDDPTPPAPGVVLAWAVWARRLGDDALAGELLTAARQHARQDHRGRSTPPEQQLAGEVASAMFLTAVRAFVLGQDDDARLALQALEARPLEDAHERRLAAALRADLARRGAPVALPEDLRDLDDVPMERRVALLVAALEDAVAPRVHRFHDDMTRDRRVQALIACGEPAIPALLDCWEKDERLCRSLRPRYGGDVAVQLHEVNDAAYLTLSKILRLDDYYPLGPEHERHRWQYDPGASRAHDVRRLRAYWAANRGLTFEERVRRAVLDEDTPPERRRDAAWALAGVPQHARRWRFGPPQVGDRTAALALSDPTAAEAILVALDAETRGDPPLGESVYPAALAALGDARVVPALRERFAGASRPSSLRLELAIALHELGSSEALDEVAADVLAGKVVEARRERTQYGGLEPPSSASRVLGALAGARRPAADAALEAVADPAHPLFDVALEKLLGVPGFLGWGDDGLASHPACLKLLRAALAVERPGGRTYSLGPNGMLTTRAERHTSMGPKPDWLDATRCQESAGGRVCDDAAALLGDLVPASIPRHHALYRDRDVSLAAVREAADRIVGRLRRPTPQEAAAMGLGAWQLRRRFIPDIAPLEEAATAEDVAAGRALFHLERSVRAAVPLPATAEVEGGRALIVQAETGPDGRRVYGAITAAGVEVVPASAVSGLCPLPDPAEHRAAAERVADAALRGDLEALAALHDPPLPPAALEQWAAGLRRLRPAELVTSLELQLVPLPGGGWRLR